MDHPTLVVTKLDRLARSTQHLLKIVEGLEEKHVALRILDSGGAEVDTKSPSGKLTLTMFAAMAQFEREMMLERQREGKYEERARVPEAKIEQAPTLQAHAKIGRRAYCKVGGRFSANIYGQKRASTFCLLLGILVPTQPEVWSVKLLVLFGDFMVPPHGLEPRTY